MLKGKGNHFRENQVSIILVLVETVRW